MRVAFRVDASPGIGNGHLMRCLVLADMLRKRGAKPIFLCRQSPGHACGLVERQHFDLRILPGGQRTESPPPAHAAWLGAGLDEELEACATHLREGADVIVLDHYALDERWEKAVRPWVNGIMVIDDLADRRHDCDVLLDQNPMPDQDIRYRDVVPAACRLLTGCSYALIHPAFRAAAERVSERKTVRRLLLSFGGGDPDNLTGTALRELASLAVPGDVVIGGAHPHRADIEALCCESGGRWTLHVQTSRMPELMAQADLALGGGGISHWERCLMGLPAVVTAMADNQVAPTEMVAERGACLYLGAADTLAEGAWREAVDRLMNEPDCLLAMSLAGREIMPDGQGGDRVADVMERQFGASDGSHG